MQQCTRSRQVRKAQSVAAPELAEFLGPDPLTEALRGEGPGSLGDAVR
jgi:hypothetical protein